MVKRESIKQFQRKLTNPLANNKKAGIHKKIAGRIKNIEIINIIEEYKSITLKTSPVNTKRPFNRRRPAQNNMNCKNGCIPKISIRKAIAAAMSITPRIFTKTMKNLKYKG